MKSKLPMIDVVIPVFGQLELTIRCIQSVLNSSISTPFELTVIDDGSEDELVGETLQKLAMEMSFSFLRNSGNFGFVATSNRAFELHPSRDVLLLNSDTVVYGDWLDRLRSIAYSHDAIGTVTPITNDAGISQYPHSAHFDVTRTDLGVEGFERLDEIAAHANPGEWVESPTGSGDCMYVTRACLNDVGQFDIDLYGHGYGEENDFSQRALHLGWKNVITPSVFVFHLGGASFGTTKATRIAAAAKVIMKHNPDFSDDVANFIELDPLGPLFDRISVFLTRSHTQNRAILIVTHNWGGGTERHVQELYLSLEKRGIPVLICRPDIDNADKINFFDNYINTRSHTISLRISNSPDLFINCLQQLGVAEVHIQNLAGYSDTMPDYLATALANSSVPYKITVNDYQYWCPRINLVGLSGYYCGEPSALSCQICIDTLGSPFGTPLIWRWRAGHERLLRGAIQVLTPSRDAASRIERHLPGLSVEVKPYEPVPQDSIATPSPVKDFVWHNVNARASDTSRIGIIGAISVGKGSQVLEDVAQYAISNELPLDFVVIGYTDRDATFSEMDNVSILGSYEDSELDYILSQLDLDAIWFPAVWPETYAYTLSAALKTGIKLVAFDLGAVAERIRYSGDGILLELETMLDPALTAQHLLQLKVV